MGYTDPSNYDDIIDSRQIIEQIEALESAEGEDIGLDEDEQEELRILKELDKDGEDATSDWQWGATLIRDSYFTDYAREFADDIGALKGRDEWPYTCIDWDKAADELQVDYTPVEFDGVTYWVR